MPFEVPPLPYDYAALAPTIDEQTMHLHHDKHHQAYVDNANKALDGTDFADRPVEEVLRNLDSLPADKQGPVRNNAGGHANHSLFWKLMGPNGGGQPSGDLAAAIDEAFGSFDDFKEKFEAAGAGQFGSGWAWLVQKDGKLDVVSTANADTPVARGIKCLLTIDVWEHAYYIDYRNQREKYVQALIEKRLNWEFAEKNLNL
jgi:Fe-Mn family superoxide dismutase